MNADDWAVCVGIQHYAAEKQLASLPGASNDARAIHDWLTSPNGGGVPAEQATLILSEPPNPEGGGQPTSAQIEVVLRGLYRRASDSSDDGKGFRAGRRLWLFYSGHGLGFPLDEDTGLVTADAYPPNDLPHVAGRAWAQLFRVSAAFDEVILFMDCCRTEANRVPLIKPPLRELRVTAPGRMMAAYAVAQNRAAFEDVVDGKPRGRFTLTLEKMLREPPERPVTARRFLELLENEYPGVDPYPPRRQQDDFTLFGAGASIPATQEPSMLIAHGETTFNLAQRLAQALPAQALVEWAGDVTKRSAESFTAINDLIVTRSLDAPALEQLMMHVKPSRTIFLGETDREVSKLSGVRFVQRSPAFDHQPEMYRATIEETLAAFRGTLAVEAHEAMAHLRVWGADGHVVGDGYGRLTLSELPVGSYRVRASLGPIFTESVAVVELDSHATVLLAPLISAPKASDERAYVFSPLTSTPARQVLSVELSNGAIALSVPTLPGWRTQVFAAEAGYSSLSIRMLPPDHEANAVLPTDLVRESLRLALATPAWAAPAPSASELENDPIALLLAAALQLRNGAPADELVDAAAALLGDDDVDVRLLRGATTVTEPPLLSWTWRHRLQRNELMVEPNSPADAIVGRQCMTDPWLAWTSEAVSGGRWLAQLATVLWPGWNTLPDRELVVDGLDAAALALGAPASSLRALAWKAPPVDRLVQHECVAFVGASNDQLAAALVVAFVERKQRKWKQLDLWSLSDAPLASLISAGRTGRPLIAARDRAEEQLRALLELVADDYTMRRYDGFMIGEKTYFASLWDWQASGGYVHVSERVQADVKTSAAENLVWTGEAAPSRFTEVVRAYDLLRSSYG
ncbi:MAG: caspase family protein [Polyangiaceae bacterium]